VKFQVLNCYEADWQENLHAEHRI